MIKTNNRIPLAPIKSALEVLPCDPKIKEIERPTTIVFNYDLLDLTHDLFNLGGRCNNWFVKMFNVLSFLSHEVTPERLYSREFTGKTSPIRFHKHKIEEVSDWPDFLTEQVDFYQIRFGLTNGGIHGLLIDNIFHIIWIDPHHNMYPNENYGGIKRFKRPGECCSYRDKELLKLEEEIKMLKEENKAFEQLFNEVAATKH